MLFCAAPSLLGAALILLCVRGSTSMTDGLSVPADSKTVAFE